MSSSNPYKVYVVVVTFNGSRWLHKCLGSLRNSRHVVHTIVIDNNSADNTIEVIEKDYPEIILIKSKLNLGFGKANNIGIAMALKDNADYIFLLNQDAWIEADVIEKLVNAQVKHPEYGILSPLHYTGSGEKLDFGFRQYLIKKYKEEGVNELIEHTSENINDADFINAAAWMLSKSCIEMVGGFGYLFNHYGEDRDYIQRLIYNGYNIGFITSCKIYHDREGKFFDLSTKQKMVWYYFTGLKTKLSDVNEPFVVLFFKGFVWCTKDLINHFIKKKYFTVSAFFEITIKILKETRQIIRYRNLIKTQSRFLFIPK